MHGCLKKLSLKLTLCYWQVISDEMRQTLIKLREKAVIGFVGGSDLSKQLEQLGTTGMCLKFIEYTRFRLTLLEYAFSFGRLRLLFL